MISFGRADRSSELGPRRKLRCFWAPHLTFSVSWKLWRLKQTPPDLSSQAVPGCTACIGMGENIPNIFSYPWPSNVLWISDNPQPHVSHLKLKQGTGQCWLKTAPNVVTPKCPLTLWPALCQHEWWPPHQGFHMGFPLHPGWAAVKARLNSHHFVNPTPEAAPSPPLPPQPEGPQSAQLHTSALWFMENHAQCPNIAQILE